jgi:hypothetical protein
METSTTLLGAQAALSQVSREELANLLVDDALDRAQSEMARLNAEANDVGQQANDLLLDIYRELRKDALLEVAPVLQAFTRGFKLADVKAKAEVYGMSMTPHINGASINDSTWPYSNERMTLDCYLTRHAHAALGIARGDNLPEFCTVHIHARTTLPRSEASLDAQVQVRPASVDLSEWVVLTRRSADCRAAYQKLESATQDSETLRRKGLAALTRHALAESGVHLENGFPTARISLPGLPG